MSASRPAAATSAGAMHAAVDRILGPGDAAHPRVPPHRSDALAALTRRVADGLAGVVDEQERRALVGIAVRAADLAAADHEASAGAHVDLRRQVDEGLRRLLRLGGSAELEDAICREASRACGFERVLLSRLDADHWWPWRLCTTGGLDPASDPVHRGADGGRALPFAGSPVEARVVRSGRPEIVQAVPGTEPARGVLPGSSSLVVVPIAPAGRALGLLHADHADRRPVDAVDQDVLVVFAETVGWILERREVSERLRAQRARGSALQATVDAMPGDDEAVELSRASDSRAGTGLPATTLRDETALADILTPRELEVLDCVVRGLGNREISHDLYITRATAKTHVSRILRKLGAPNRAAAVGLVLGRGAREG
ncbi:LuxR C-terminal-related transcriptional regulator [Patulibacter sp. NPDC049589]|uniref:LuxR C-terminal-related transcriptional regulator n=1 Tax=Patulibacter sp. NPDC049589 TaxID=3154731 RepID=UPI003425EEB8